MLGPGMNPRDNVLGHRERGLKRFTYTYQDLANLYGVGIRTIRNWVAGSGQPFDPSDLESVCRLWCKRHRHGGQAVSLKTPGPCPTIPRSAASPSLTPREGGVVGTSTRGDPRDRDQDRALCLRPTQTP